MAAAQAPAQAQTQRTGNAAKFVIGGLSGMGATMVVQPLDLVKTRMQLATGRTGTVSTLMTVARQEGVTALYNGYASLEAGASCITAVEAVLILAVALVLLINAPFHPPGHRLSAALLRQATYTTTRLGVYNSLEERFSSADGKPPSFLAKAAIGMTAGAAGAVVGTPSEVALVRMMSDGRLPLEQRRGYKNVFDALWRVVTEEGVLTLWRGTGPTVLRAMALNAAQLASYSQAKELLARYAGLKDGIPLHFSASLCSGFIATTVSLPVDITKTKIQTMKVVNGVPEYKGAVDVLVKTVQREGILRLWKGCVRGARPESPGSNVVRQWRGAALTTRICACIRRDAGGCRFTPYFMRLGPHTIFTFLIQEQLTKSYKAWAASK